MNKGRLTPKLFNEISAENASIYLFLPAHLPVKTVPNLNSRNKQQVYVYDLPILISCTALSQL